jgi:hypothetical protein
MNEEKGLVRPEGHEDVLKQKHHEYKHHQDNPWN